MKKIIGILIFTLLVSGLFAALPRSIYFPVTIDGVPIVDGSGITTEYWILSRPGEVATPFIFVAAFGGCIMIDLEYFSTPWAIGDVLHCEVTFDGNMGYGEVVIPDLTGDPIFPPATSTIDIITGPPIIDWGDGVTGSVDVGVAVAGGAGYGSGLPNEDDLVNPANAGYWFTLTIDNALLPLDLTVCLYDLVGYQPFNLAYWGNSGWVYEPATGPLSWSGDCVTFTLDPTGADRGGKTKDSNTRADVDIPIVFSNIDGPLPVTLSNFSTAVFANKFVEISWTTESELGNQGWNIYRGLSDNAELVTKLNVGLIEGAGSTMESTDYNFIDENVENNTTYWYWLESVSNGGETDLHGPSRLTVLFEEDPTPEIPNQTELIGNHPNPFNPGTFIVFNVKADEQATLTIFNTRGQSVMNKTFDTGFHNYNWQADSYPSGVYFYRLETESHTSTKKMLLLK